MADVVGVCGGMVRPRPTQGSSCRRSRSGRLGGTRPRTAPHPGALRCSSCSAVSQRTAERWGGNRRAVHADRRRAADHAGRRVGPAARDGGRARGCRRRRARPRGAGERPATAGGVGGRRSSGDRPASFLRDPERPCVLETNVDDLDPRLWPGVLARAARGGRQRRLADADPDEEGPPGAHPERAGRRRPASTAVRDVRVPPDLDASGCAMLRVGKHALDRRMATVQVGGCEVAVKVALLDGRAGQRATGVRGRRGRRARRSAARSRT